MMGGLKVVTAREMARIEGLASRAGSSEREFMENAGREIAFITDGYVSSLGLDRVVTLLVGKGNNGGDAYAAGRYLLQKGYKVSSLHLYSLQACSSLCVEQHDMFVKMGGQVTLFRSEHDLAMPAQGVLLDGLAGTGFQGRAEGPFLRAIEKANQSGLPILSIDIPSGLNGNTGEVISQAIKADVTIYLELPKIGFFIGNGWNHVGKLVRVKFGLKEEYYTQAKPEALLWEPAMASRLLPVMSRDRHKYQAGYVLCVAGSFDMPGAAILSSFSALRAGAGIVRLFYPCGMEAQLSGAPPELIKEAWDLESMERILEEQQRASAIVVGPGLGREAKIAKMLKELFVHLKLPAVVDGDALFFLSENPKWQLPPCTILTPHHGEMQRLLSTFSENVDSGLGFIASCKDFAEKKRVTLIVKGAPTMIYHSTKTPMIVTAGDPGMATAGSGDVLTGIIAALLAQGMDAYAASVLGVYLHGRAGEKAAESTTSYCMVASDILSHLPDAFWEMEEDYKANE